MFYLNAFHDGFSELFLPVLLPRSVGDVIIKFVHSVASEIAVRFT